jgi:hypothetical protein
MTTTVNGDVKLIELTQNDTPKSKFKSIGVGVHGTLKK